MTGMTHVVCCTSARQLPCISQSQAEAGFQFLSVAARYKQLSSVASIHAVLRVQLHPSTWRA